MAEAKDDSSDIKTIPVSEFLCTECQQTVDSTGAESFDFMDCPHCGAFQIVPARLGHFLLVDLLGEGATATVFEGVDENLDRRVAVKVLQPHLAQDEEFLATLRHEAKLAASLNHTNVAKVYTLNVSEGQPFLVMELLSGGSLKDMMDEQGRLPESLVLKTAMDAAKGLRAAADSGLVHGDIKPANILFSSKGVAKIVDFGLACRIDGTNELSGLWGTPHYIAPERVQKKTPDFTSDIYSLGATMYHALAGRQPFPGKTVEEVIKPRLSRTPMPIRKYRKKITPAVDSLVSRMLQPQRSKRHPTFESLLGEMSRAHKVVPKSRKNIQTRRKVDREQALLIKPHTQRQPRPGGKKGKRKTAKKAAPRSSKSIMGWVLAGIILAAGLLVVGLFMARPTNQPASRRSTSRSSSKSKSTGGTRRTITVARPAIEPVTKRLHVFEAEHFHASHRSIPADNTKAQGWVAIKDPKASGGIAMVVPDDSSKFRGAYTTQAPRLDYRVNIPRGGPHSIWILGRSNPGEEQRGASDSVHVAVDGKACAAGKAITGFDKTFTWSRTPMNNKFTPIRLRAGIRIISLCQREDGFVCDRIVVAPFGQFKDRFALEKAIKALK